jgi:uncharacterized membrane protein YdjX (TVP38/TMEM64 family)
LICVGLAVIGTSAPVHEVILDVLTAASEVIATHPGWGATVFVLLSAASAMVAFFSTGVLVPVAVVTWREQVTFALLWLGWILGGVVAYTVGRLLGRRVVAGLTSGRGLAYADRVSRAAPFGLVLLFQLGLPSEIPGYVLGLARYSFAKYLLALALAELPYAVVMVYLGVSFLEGQTTLLAVIAVVVLVLAAWAFQTLHHRLATLSPDAEGT